MVCCGAGQTEHDISCRNSTRHSAISVATIWIRRTECTQLDNKLRTLLSGTRKSTHIRQGGIFPRCSQRVGEACRGFCVERRPGLSAVLRKESKYFFSPSPSLLKTHGRERERQRELLPLLLLLYPMYGRLCVLVAVKTFISPPSRALSRISNEFGEIPGRKNTNIYLIPLRLITTTSPPRTSRRRL